MKALFERELTSSSFGFQLPELGGRFGIKSGASAHYNATLLIRPRARTSLVLVSTSVVSIKRAQIFALSLFLSSSFLDI